MLYKIISHDFYGELKTIKDWFDFSSYPENHPLYNTKNKGIPGKFKDECNLVQIKEFIGLRAKLYSILLDDENEKRATAGVKRNVAEKKLRHVKFQDVFDNQNMFDITQRVIRHQKHVLYTEEKTRVGLSAYDDKRYILNDMQSTLPYGHWRI